MRRSTATTKATSVPLTRRGTQGSSRFGADSPSGSHAGLAISPRPVLVRWIFCNVAVTNPWLSAPSDAAYRPLKPRSRQRRKTSRMSARSLESGRARRSLSWRKKFSPATFSPKSSC